MRRRDFVAGLGATAAQPLSAWGQQRAPVIGLLEKGSPGPVSHLVEAFRKGLGELGYGEGRNVSIEYQFAEGIADRLPALAAELVSHRVSVIVTPGSTPAALAAKAATKEIPIVFSMGGDPVRMGLVASLNRPGGNITGVTFIAVELVPKRLGLLLEMLPRAKKLGVLIDPMSPYASSIVVDVQAAASKFGLELDLLYAGDVTAIDKAFAEFAQRQVQALLVSPSPLFLTRRAQLGALAARFAIPTVSPQREYAQAGGLMSYGGSYPEEYRLIGTYAGRILKGETPADLPVMQPTKLELVVNLKTAKTLGLTIPETLLATADEVLE